MDFKDCLMSLSCFRSHEISDYLSDLYRIFLLFDDTFDGFGHWSDLSISVLTGPVLLSLERIAGSAGLPTGLYLFRFLQLSLLVFDLLKKSLGFYL